jgi:hypothetical protein
MRSCDGLVCGVIDVAWCSGSEILSWQMVEMASKKFVCIVDDTKLVDGLGGSGGDAAAASLLQPYTRRSLC